MQLNLLTILTALLSVTFVQAALSADEIVNNINALTDLTSEANDLVADLTITNSITTLPQVITKLRDIIEIANSNAEAVSGGADLEFSEEDQARICDALERYATANSDFASTLASKNGILGATPFSAPIAQALRVAEGNVDTLAFGLIDVVPTCAADAQNSLNTLDEAFENLISPLS